MERRYNEIWKMSINECYYIHFTFDISWTVNECYYIHLIMFQLPIKKITVPE